MIDERIKSLGITLAAPPRPAGSYVPVAVSGETAYVSGQIPVRDGKLAYRGKVGDHNTDEACKSARLCAINVLAQLRAELGSLDRVDRILAVSGFVNSLPEFTGHSKVMNSASDLLREIFGEAGVHSRIAVGVASLPLDAMTEISAIVRLAPPG